VLSDPIDDGAACTPRIVQVRDTVGKAWSKVQQRSGGLSRHARPPVGSASTNALKQSEHDAHSSYAVERCDNRHLSGTGICEAHLHSCAQCGFDQAKCTCVHMILSLVLP
jgi:hypothetical protein